MGGVWTVYGYRAEFPYAMSLHATYEDAELEVSETGEGTICLWPFGTDLVTAITDWIYCGDLFH